MSKAVKTFKAIPQTTVRRLRYTPSYIFLLWRWGTWLLALITIVSVYTQPSENLPNPNLASLLLTVTFLQTLVVTLYAPVFQFLLPGLPRMRKLRLPRPAKLQSNIWSHRQPPLAADGEADFLTPLARTRYPYWDIGIYALDVIICGMVTYYGGFFGTPHFGVGSPFYRYGLSTALVAGFAYRYRGGLAAAFGYDLFILFGAFFPPTQIPYDALNVRDLASSLLDAPLAAILAAYLATLLGSYTRSKRREQDNVRRQLALLSVGETLVRGASDRQSLLQRSAEQIRKGGHFERLVIALTANTSDEDNDNHPQLEIDTYAETGIDRALSPRESRELLEKVLQTGEKLVTFTALTGDLSENTTYRLARLYLPFFKDGQVHLVLGAESTRQTPFERKYENFLAIVGGQLMVALENLRLTEQTAELAAAAERSRLAREIHDGVIQVIYMLSLNTETCAALAHRIADVSEEDEELLHPLAERLDRLVALSKQALWETRHYMFTLKPLITGTSTLSQMLTTQLREFEAITALPAHLEVTGTEESPNGDKRHSRKTAQVGTAIFRITQEALTNAYKHADATQIQVHLRHLPHCIEVEIDDDGTGLNSTTQASDEFTENGEHQRIYSGHGIRGMRERAEELGGTFEVKQASTGGVSVLARIPR